MSASILLRFVDPKAGPVVSITSTPYPSFWRRRLWHSTARLGPGRDQPSAAKVFEPCGGGWSRDKEQSQCKAVTEAIEMWAFEHAAKSAPDGAGLDLDPTSNGFAALPQAAGEQRLFMSSYCEALERWALNRTWDHGDLRFCVVQPPGDVLELFSRFQGKLHCFEAVLENGRRDKWPAAHVAFCLCVFQTAEGGAIPGSACGEDREATLERAVLEAFINAVVFERMRRRKLTSFEDILEQRIYFFGSHKQGFEMVREKVKENGDREPHATPEVVFEGLLAGPWNPEVLVSRVLVRGSMPVCEGGDERFVI